MFEALIRGVRSRLRRNTFERDLDRELQYHLDRETEENVRRGMSLAEARRTARISLGGVEQTKEDCRDAKGLVLVEGLMQDVRYSIRSLRRNPGYTAVVLLTLALGIGANTAIFSVVYGVLLRPLPYGAGDRLVELEQTRARVNDLPVAFSVKEIADYREQNHSFDDVAEYHSMSFILLGNAEPERVRTGVVSADFFDLFGVTPVLGRTFVPEDEGPGADAVLVLSNRYWMTHLGGDPNVVGRTFEMNDKVHTVIGVLPALPPFPDDNDVFMTTSACPFRSSAQVVDDRTAHMVKAFARLRSGATAENAQTDLNVISERLCGAYPEVYPADVGYTTTLTPLREVISGDARPALLVLFATALLVLLIGCANVANLALARTSRREHELAIRATLGAGRGRLMRQLLTEGLIISLVAGALGLAGAAVGLRVLLYYTAKFLPRIDEIHIDTSVLLFTLAAAIVTGLAFSAMPALSARRSLVPALGSGARVAAGAKRMRSALIVLQVAAAFVLLTCAGLMLQTFVRLQQVDAGFNEQHLISIRIALNWSKYTTPQQVIGFYDRLLERIEGNPQVISVACATGVPLAGRPFFQSVSLEGDPLPADASTPQADVTVITPGYFKTMGIRVLEGRDFTKADDDKAPQVVVVGETMARHRWHGKSPIGSRITNDNGKTWYTVVGVVSDVKGFGLASEPGDQFYGPFAQSPGGGPIFVRTNAEVASMARFVRDSVYEIDPNQPVTDVQTLEEVRNNWMAPSRLTTMLIGLFAALALTITAAGIGGVMALWVSQRTREIGVRMALGATRSRVLSMVLRQGMAMAIAGIALGVAGALAATQLLSGLLFGVEPTDAITYVAVAALLVTAAAAACFAPGRRATSIDPIVALRAE